LYDECRDYGVGHGANPTPGWIRAPFVTSSHFPDVRRFGILSMHNSFEMGERQIKTSHDAIQERRFPMLYTIIIVLVVLVLIGVLR
jgi:hypothetical protein